MRAREILSEDYNQDLVSDLGNILMAASGSGASEVSTPDVVYQLDNMGYSVTVNSLLNLLSQVPYVSNATPEIINLSQQDSNGVTDTEDSASQVQDMAQAAANKMD